MPGKNKDKPPVISEPEKKGGFLTEGERRILAGRTHTLMPKVIKEQRELEKQHGKLIQTSNEAPAELKKYEAQRAAEQAAAAAARSEKANKKPPTKPAPQNKSKRPHSPGG